MSRTSPIHHRTRWQRITEWTYSDIPLFCFVLIMVAAASITSHGTYMFYSYILPVELAVAATVVLTAGIPLLELASVLDKRIDTNGKETTQMRYLVGLCFLLLLEALAQYFQGQAGFTTSITAQWAQPTGVDLATFALEPRGRLLPLLYLAALSGVVVYFGYAASARIRDLRKRHARLQESVITAEEHAALIRRIGASESQITAAQSLVATLTADRDEARTIAQEAHERAEQLSTHTVTDDDIVSALASGLWPLSRQADELSKATSQNAAASALGTNAQNLANWRKQAQTTNAA